ncbi:hypothetical protein DSL72_005015 [Monilinia vaccinii-corymbosi]|uniref:Uncharacterized protein n=1 Tax=Monilinia vaccinii-corymbosi TaxID=61207 RepID=A0A8A3PE16_9HELO|nr:hypothetical protein DSL72_005015 [Monilinia vaccinii-corymbosi]
MPIAGLQKDYKFQFQARISDSSMDSFNEYRQQLQSLEHENKQRQGGARKAKMLKNSSFPYLMPCVTVGLGAAFITRTGPDGVGDGAALLGDAWIRDGVELGIDDEDGE